MDCVWKMAFGRCAKMKMCILNYISSVFANNPNKWSNDCNRLNRFRCLDMSTHKASVCLGIWWLWRYWVHNVQKSTWRGHKAEKNSEKYIWGIYAKYVYCMHFKAKEHILASIQNLSKSSLQHGPSLQKVFNSRHEL